MNTKAFIATATLLLGYAYAGDLQAREWTLAECIDYARENNVQVQQARISKLNSDEDLAQAKAQLLPSLGFSSSQNYQVPEGTYSGSYGLNSSMTLYKGGYIRNSIEIQKLYNEGYDCDILEAQNNIEIQVAQAYLDILYAKETVTANENTLDASRAQLDRAKEMLEAGSVSLSEYAQFEAQYSSDNYQLVTSRNSLDQNILTLKQLLELGMDEEFSVSFPELDDDDVLKVIPSVADVYYAAVESMPQMTSGRLDIEAAQINEKVAAAGALPSLSASASVGSGNGSLADMTFLDQLSNRVNGGAGLTLSIPIYSNRSVRTSKAKAANQTRSAELSYRSAQKSMLSTIESLHQNAVSAQSRYLAAQAKLKSAGLSYELQNEKFNEGMINAVELLNEKNTLTAAQRELNQAKYQAILSLELLDFYQNRPIEL